MILTEEQSRFDAVLINGSVGTGKTTTAEELGHLLEERGIPGAVIDVDHIRRAWPAPPGDRFRTALALENLRALAANFRRNGARVLVVASVVESVEELQETREALRSERAMHVRLVTDPAVVLSRLAQRHGADTNALQWHARRHPELARVLDAAGFTEELRIDTTRASAREVARNILEALAG